MNNTIDEKMKQMRGDHYRNHGRETIDVIEDFLDDDNGLEPITKYHVGQAMKYLLRLGRKGGSEMIPSDLYKAENYLHRARTGHWMPGDEK